MREYMRETNKQNWKIKNGERERRGVGDGDQGYR